MSSDVYTNTSYLKIGNIHRYIIKYKLYDNDIQDLYHHSTEEESDDDLVKKSISDEYLSLAGLQINEDNAKSFKKRRASFVEGSPDKIIVKVTNTIPISMGATGVLLGPHSLYVDLKKQKFDHKIKFFESSDIPKFEANLLPTQELKFELTLNDFTTSELVWELDIISQALFTTNCKIFYNLDISYQFEDKIYTPSSKVELELLKQNLSITKLETSDLWQFPMIKNIDNNSQNKCHLVILTHGMMSNVTADMLYLAEQIKKKDNNCILTGNIENVCKTERGIRYQGIKNGEFLIKEINKIGIENIGKLSFIGHSLGGLVQTFAISYCFKKYPEIMNKLHLENFITLASPLLGVLNDNPKYLQKLLTMGIVGKSGQDLGLAPITEYNDQPFISILLCAHTRNCLRRFKNRTIYANSINDGVVPLYTASLLFIDYDDVVKSFQKLSSNITVETTNLNTEDIKDTNNIKSTADENSKKNKYFWKPLMKMSTLFAPQAATTDVTDNKDDYASVSEKGMAVQLPKLSFLDSAQHVLLQPVPPLKYIMDPETRESTIIHDKAYYPDDIKSLLETQRYKTLLYSEQDFQMNKDEMLVEEELAMKWHKNLSWRKVIVALEPDAHNNINVRRQFHNAYGWEVVDHIIDNHFGEQKIEDTETIKIEDKIIEEEEEETDDICDYNWLLTFEQESVIDGGVTGMIPTVSDFVDKWYKKLVMTVDENDGNEIKTKEINGETVNSESATMKEIQLAEQELMYQYCNSNT